MRYIRCDHVHDLDPVHCRNTIGTNRPAVDLHRKAVEEGWTFEFPEDGTVIDLCPEHRSPHSAPTVAE